MKVTLASIFIGLIATTYADFVPGYSKDGTGNEAMTAPVIPPAQEDPQFANNPVLPVNCPEMHSPDENVLLANPKDCTTFYRCVWGYPHLQHCPEGLHFNDKKKWCDRPRDAHCVVDNAPTTAHVIPPAPEDPQLGNNPVLPVECPEMHSSDENVLLANPKDCTTFYQCVWGYPHLQHCPEGLHFNDKLALCDHPRDAHCVVKP